MKKNLSISIIAVTLIAVVALFYLLNKNKHCIISENFSRNEVVYLSEEDSTLGSLTIDLNVDFPTEYYKLEILQNIKTILHEALFGEIYNLDDAETALDSYVKDLGKEYVDNNSDFAKKASDESLFIFNHTILLEGFSLLSDEKIYSYGIKRFVDFGGAHPMQTRYYYNFDIKTGDLIAETDIFKDDFYDELTTILQNTFIESFENTDYSANKGNISDYTISDIKPNGNFYINDKAICYVYNTYEIAPYYLGGTEIVLPYDAINHLMKEKNPLTHLYKNKK